MASAVSTDPLVARYGREATEFDLYVWETNEFAIGFAGRSGGPPWLVALSVLWSDSKLQRRWIYSKIRRNVGLDAAAREAAPRV